MIFNSYKVLGHLLAPPPSRLQSHTLAPLLFIGFSNLIKKVLEKELTGWLAPLLFIRFENLIKKASEKELAGWLAGLYFIGFENHIKQISRKELQWPPGA